MIDNFVLKLITVKSNVRQLYDKCKQRQQINPFLQTNELICTITIEK